MVNVVVNKHEKYSMCFSYLFKAFSRTDMRQCTVCEIYAPDGMLIAAGQAILNPLDAFNPRIGMHKAVESAVLTFDLDTRRAFHRQVDEWYEE